MNRIPISKRLVMAGALAGSVVTGGVVGATLLGPTFANAATTAATGSSAATSTDTGSAAAPAMPEHGSQAHESAETPATGDNATKAQAAAVKAVGSGTAGAVTSDFRHGGYEVTVTKADGSTVDVHLDSAFNVMMHGGPGGHGGNDKDADDAATGSGSSSSSSASVSG